MTSIHPKVSAAGLGGVLVTLAASVLAWRHVNVPTDVVASATTLIAVLAGWLMPSRVSADASIDVPDEVAV